MSVNLAENSSDFETVYRRMVFRRVSILVCLAAAIVISLAIDIVTGPSIFPVEQLIAGLFDPETLTAAQNVILFQIRMPDALIAIVVGAALGLAGVETQTILNNPLASPFTLGISSTAALGASLAIVFDVDFIGIPSQFVLPIFAFVGAIAAGLAILSLTAVYGGSVNTAILFGIALVFLSSALTAAVQYVASAEAVQQIVFWDIGNLTRAGWTEVAIVAVVLVAVAPFSWRDVWRLTLLKGGEEQAKSIGVPVEKLRMRVILRTSILSAVAVCFVGTIGFIGLVGPHIARIIFGENHKFLLPGSALCGALLLSLASILSKSILPGAILPTGIVTSIIGVPIFLALIMSTKRVHL